jgi:hypothetical protein
MWAALLGCNAQASTGLQHMLELVRRCTSNPQQQAATGMVPPLQQQEQQCNIVVHPPAGTRYPLERVKDAIAAHEQPGRQGKILLESRGVGLSRLSRASTEDSSV